MKIIYTYLSRYMTRICAAGMALLGFGCSSSEPPCMYGTPTGSFEIKGKVTAEDGSSVPDATMRATDPDFQSGIESFASEKTGSDGDYNLSGSSFPISRMKVVCIPDDPELKPDSTIVKMDYVKNKHNSSSWNEGKASVSLNFTLKKRHDGK